MGQPTGSTLVETTVTPVYNSPASVDTVLNQSGNQTGFTSGDLAVGSYHELQIDFNLSSLTGGTSPSFNVVTKRKGADGIYYTVDTPTTITAVGTISRSLGAGLAQNVAFGDLIQVVVAVTGAPTGAAWTLSIKGKQAV